MPMYSVSTNPDVPDVEIDFTDVAGSAMKLSQYINEGVFSIDQGSKVIMDWLEATKED